jgi:tripartite-type tricarboxylate transporter receptor subunit TctC
MFDVMPSSIEYIRAGKLRAPAVITDTRSQALPNLHERFLAGLRGKLPPKNTAAEILHKLNNEINAAMADPKMMARLAEMGGLMQSGSPASFDKFVAAKTEKWAKVGEICGHQAGVIRVMSGGWHPVPQNCDNRQRYSKLQREFWGL